MPNRIFGTRKKSRYCVIITMPRHDMGNMVWFGWPFIFTYTKVKGFFFKKLQIALEWATTQR